jgi:hypothetical protein
LADGCCGDMVRRFITNLQVNLAAGFLLFFFSERLFWTIFKPGDQIFELVITWLAYSVLACVFLNIESRFGASDLSRIALAGAVYGWLAEGALVGTLYGTESSAPFPLSIVVTTLSWHMLLSVLVGWYFLTGAVRQGSVVKTATISVGVGLFWAVWAPFQWRETPPVMVPISNFVAHAALIGTCLAVACGILSGESWTRYNPGWFGLGVSVLVLVVFYSEQVKALGLRPLILLPLLIAFVLALLHWTKSKNDQPMEHVAIFKRWKCAAAIMIMPLTATIVYAFQISIETRGINPSLIFHGLAVVGGVAFVAACGRTIRNRLTREL